VLWLISVVTSVRQENFVTSFLSTSFFDF